MDELSAAWDARIEALLRRLPARIGSGVAWLREPSRYVIRFAVGILLVLGGIFSILPVLGIWMLPLGLALLAEDMPGLKPVLERAVRWSERRWRTWRGRKAPTPEAERVRVRPPSGA